MKSRTFAFEADFAAGLRCIPMAVRYKLDLCGVKLGLGEWSRLGPEARRELLERDADGPYRLGYRERARALVRERCGAPPAEMAPVDDPAGGDGPPAEALALARERGLALRPGAWEGLDALQRFALRKLSRPGHGNRNFAAALAEFGMLAGESAATTMENGESGGDP